jgi:hypothetical protein
MKAFPRLDRRRRPRICVDLDFVCVPSKVSINASASSLATLLHRPYIGVIPNFLTELYLVQTLVQSLFLQVFGRNHLIDHIPPTDI